MNLAWLSCRMTARQRSGAIAIHHRECRAGRFARIFVRRLAVAHPGTHCRRTNHLAHAIARCFTDLEVNALSGGSQQKVAIAKWLQIHPDFSSTSPPAVLTSPPKEIYQLMNHWTAQGIAILLITSEMIELLTLSDRIAVMHRGQVTAEFSRNQAAQKAVLSAAMGSISLVHAPDFQN